MTNLRLPFLILLAHLLLALPAQAQKAKMVSEKDELDFTIDFDYRQSTLPREATRILDRVAVLLKDNPKAKVDIASHTDARGSSSYNLRLSQKRAQSVAAYLAKKGIKTTRITSKGFGESRPLNRCKRGVHCSEAEFGENRRTEIRLKSLPAEVMDAAQAPKAPAPENSAKPKPAAAKTEAKESKPITYSTKGGPSPNIFTKVNSLQEGDAKPESAEQYIATALPGGYEGYAVEIARTDRPLFAGHPVLRQFTPVYMHRDTDGKYGYYIGQFQHLSDLRNFYRSIALPKFPQAELVYFDGLEKAYLKN